MQYKVFWPNRALGTIRLFRLIYYTSMSLSLQTLDFPLVTTISFIAMSPTDKLLLVFCLYFWNTWHCLHIFSKMFLKKVWLYLIHYLFFFPLLIASGLRSPPLCGKNFSLHLLPGITLHWCELPGLERFQTKKFLP